MPPGDVSRRASLKNRRSSRRGSIMLRSPNQTKEVPWDIIDRCLTPLLFCHALAILLSTILNVLRISQVSAFTLFLWFALSTIGAVWFYHNLKVSTILLYILFNIIECYYFKILLNLMFKKDLEVWNLKTLKNLFVLKYIIYGKKIYTLVKILLCLFAMKYRKISLHKVSNIVSTQYSCLQLNIYWIFYTILQQFVLLKSIFRNKSKYSSMKIWKIYRVTIQSKNIWWFKTSCISQERCHKRSDINLKFRNAFIRYRVFFFRSTSKW